MASKSIHEFKATLIDGKRIQDFQDFKGKVLLIVNVASKCGYASSDYPQMRTLDEKYYDKGLRILCFPCNQFLGQEPGTNDQINEVACQFSPRFVMFDKIDVNGKNESPIYSFLKSKCKGFLTQGIKWNFTKFLVDQRGIPVRRYGPNENPLSIEPEIQKLLSSPPTNGNE